MLPVKSPVSYCFDMNAFRVKFFLPKVNLFLESMKWKINNWF